MNKILALLVGLGIPLAWGAQNIRKAQETYTVRVVTADEAVPVYANDPQYFRTNEYEPHYNEVCIKANYASTTERVYISTFSTTDDANFGWPLVGTEKECHDWDQGVPLYIWRENVGVDKEVRFLFVK